MLLLLLIYHLFQEGANALPIALADAAESGTPSACLDIRHCRQIADIVIGCLTTVFACTWVSLHNNVPPPRRSTRTIWGDRIGLAVMALLLPEAIVALAGKEYARHDDILKMIDNAASRRDTLAQAEGHDSMQPEPASEGTVIAGLSTGAALISAISADELHSFVRHKSVQTEPEATVTTGLPGAVLTPAIPETRPPWTRVHSFFVQMGGFYLDDKARGKSTGPLSPKDIATLVEHGYVLPPAEDIEDKSKGDWLSKGVALLQTFWFLAQCIARRAQHLSITQLEVVTLSYCVINLLIYACWWHKPLSVDRPIHIDITRLNSEVRDYFLRPRDQPITTLWQELRRIIRPNTANEPANITYTESQPERNLIVIFFIIGTVFGALHFVAWSYPFPSHTQRVLWRVCCVALVCTPYLGSGGMFPVMMGKSLDSGSLVCSGIFALLYIFARATTMVISFTTLSFLAPSATETVQWTSFIPHF